MAFRKAKSGQAALKVGLYGNTGSGKTFTALLLAEGLAKLSGKRIAYVDTERGTDFYSQAVPERKVHPEAFDFDAIYTRSITEISNDIRALDTNKYSVVVLDSMTHLWEAAKAAYSGKINRAGQIPFHAWQGIKRPYKDLEAFLLSSPLHVFFCGRQGNEFDEDEESGEMKKVGTKMKAEGETPYEPHILFHMERIRGKGDSVVTAFAEKDRTGILSGKTIHNPNFDNVVKPLLKLLGETQARMESADETSSKDAEAIEAAESAKEEASSQLLKEYSARMDLAKTRKDLDAISKELTSEIKSRMVTNHVAQLREKYGELSKKLTA